MDEPTARELTPDELMAVGADTTRLHIAVNVLRPGFIDIIERIENTYFMPPYGDNNLFDLITLKFSNMPYGLISVPFGYMGAIEVLLKQHHTRLANGTHYVLEKMGATFLACHRDPARLGYVIRDTFPVRGPTVYTLESDIAGLAGMVITKG